MVKEVRALGCVRIPSSKKGLTALIVILLIIFSIISYVAEAYEGGGPAFNSVAVPTVHSDKDFIPANYTHYITLITKFLNSEGKDGALAWYSSSTYINRTSVRFYSHGVSDTFPKLSITDINLVSLKKEEKYLITQYLNKSVVYVTKIKINGHYYPPINYFVNGRSLILGSWNYGSRMLLVYSALGNEVPPLTFSNNFPPVSDNVLYLTVLNSSNAETYLLDLGISIDRSPYADGDVIRSLKGLPLSSHIATDVNSGILTIVATSLSWPKTPVGGSFYDFVKDALETGDHEAFLTPGVVIARINISNMDVLNAYFVFSPRFNVTAKSIHTSDNGFLLLLASLNSLLLVKMDANLNTQWEVKIQLRDGLLIPNESDSVPNTYQQCLQLAETEHGFVAAFPYKGKPSIIMVDKEGYVSWGAIDRIGERTVKYAEISSSTNQVILKWVYKGGFSETTLFSINGSILGRFTDTNLDSILSTSGLITGLEGALGEESVIISRPDGVGLSPHIKILAGYLMPDYLSAEMGDVNPFKNWMKTHGNWSIYGAKNSPFKISYSSNDVRTERYRNPILIRSGDEWNAAEGNVSIKSVRVETVMHPLKEVEVTPSFIYPAILAPKEIDFGEVHIGEEKVVDAEIITLVKRPEAPRLLISHPSPPFMFNITGASELLEKTEVGGHIKIRFHFTPSKEGLQTKTIVIALTMYGEWGTTLSQTTITLRGVGITKDKPITVGTSPLRLGLSAIALSSPPFIKPGIRFRETIYITNVGNAEAVFTHGVLVPPGVKVEYVSGADQVIKAPDTQDYTPFFIIVNRLKPQESRGIDLYITVTPEVADPNSPYHTLQSAGLPYGAVAFEISALPPDIWSELESRHGGDKASMVDEAYRVYREYLYEMIMNLSTKPIDEVNDILVATWEENPAIMNYIDMVAEDIILKDWIFNDSAVNYAYFPNGSFIILPGQDWESLSAKGSLVHGHGRSKESLFMVVSAQTSSPGILWYMKEFFKPDEFVETAKEGLIGLGKGAVEGAVDALTLGMVHVDMEAQNDYQAVGKSIGYVAANVELILADAAGLTGKAISTVAKPLGKAASRLALKSGTNLLEVVKSGRGAYLNAIRKMRELGSVGVQRVYDVFKPMNQWAEVRLGLKRIKLPTLLENYKMFGIEAIFPSTEGKIYGNIIKLAENKKFGGWYIGIDFNPARVVTVKGGKKIYTGIWHYYILSGKLSVFNPLTGQYEEIMRPILQPFMKALFLKATELGIRTYGKATVLKAAANILPQTLTFQFLSELFWEGLPTLTYSFDPNELTLKPSPYIRRGEEYIYTTITFENAPNATAEAENVTIIAHLQGPINESSITLWDSSHPGNLTYFKVVKDGEVRIQIKFTNINLPPNRNPPEGQGWVTVRYGIMETASPGDKVKGYAEIRFDENPPITTELATTTYDPTPPEIQVLHTENGSQLKLAISVNDGISGTDEAALTLIGHSFEKTYFLNESVTELNFTLNPGNYTILTFAADKAGNIATHNTTITIKKLEAETPARSKEPPTWGEGSLSIILAIIGLLALVTITLYMLKFRKRSA